MSQLTAALAAEARRLCLLLDNLAINLDDYTIGDLRSRLDEAARDAEAIVDEIGSLDTKLDELQIDEALEEQRAYLDHVADLADAASY